MSSANSPSELPSGAAEQQPESSATGNSMSGAVDREAESRKSDAVEDLETTSKRNSKPEQAPKAQKSRVQRGGTGFGRRIKIYAVSMLLLLTACCSGVYWMTTMPGQSFTGQAPALNETEQQLAKRLNAHVKMLAETIGTRNHYFQESYDRSQKYLTEELKRYGYQPRELAYSVRLSVAETVEAVNLEAIVEPAQSQSPRYLVIGAHYDTYADTPGANDNGSGVAVVLELARRMKHLKLPVGLRFVFFANEEPPHFAQETMGSRHYALRLKSESVKMLGMMSIETVGYYSQEEGSQKYPFPFSVRYPNKGNFLAFVGNPMSRAMTQDCVRHFRKYAKIPSEGATIPATVRGVDWSDHRSFWPHGVPAIMITDTAPNRYALYHTPNDLPDKLDYQSLARVTSGLEAMIKAYCEQLGNH